MADCNTNHARLYFTRSQRTTPQQIWKLHLRHIRGLPPPTEYPILCIRLCPVRSYLVRSSCMVHHLDYYMLIVEFDSERQKRITIELADEHIVVKMGEPYKKIQVETRDPLPQGHRVDSPEDTDRPKPVAKPRTSADS